MMRSNWPVISLAVAVALFALYWFLTGGVPEPGNRLRWLTSRPIAHRGLYTEDGRRPENSMAAFRAAIEAGHPFEFDVHLTADDEVVVFHDDDLERMTGNRRAISDLTLSELKALRLLGSNERIPTLEEVLAEVRGRVPILVEVKNRGSAGKLEDEVARQLALYDGDVAVISFNPFSLSRFAERAHEIPRGQLSGTFAEEDLAGYKKFVLGRMLMNWASRPHFVAYELVALPSWETALQQRRGRPLIAWTADDDEALARAEGIADNTMFGPEATPAKLEPAASE